MPTHAARAQVAAQPAGARPLGPLARMARSLAAAMLLLVAGCTVALEPAYNETIVAELEALTMDTEVLFAVLPNGIPPTGYQERSDTYAALAARAATIKLYAEARPAPSGRVADFFSNLFSPAAPPAILATAGGERATGNVEGDAYANATAGYMEDYLRNLKRLADRDRENVEAVIGTLDSFEAVQAAYLSALETYRQAYSDWVLGKGPKPGTLQAAPVAPTGAVSANFVERRRVVIEDILRDALFYERDVLNRNR